MTYFETLTKQEQRDVKRLANRDQGLTIEAWELINGEVENEEVETFRVDDIEKAAEFLFWRKQDVFGTITFNY